MSRKLKRLFIANRGEIARRIALGAKNFGLETVAITRHPTPPQYLLGLVDHSIVIADESPQTYLNADFMVQLALDHGCDSVHPGFGFLSENAGFAAKVRKAGLTFIGPTAEAINAMASKEKARHLAVAAKIPCVPALKDVNLTQPQEVLAEARSIGFPLLIKAALGGGGKGMRLCYDENQLLDLAKQAAREAESSFGDGTLIIEKYLEAPRHVEVQLLGDQTGTVVAIGDRDCSVQRRHQKIIEEAPAPQLSAETRQALHEAACRLGSAVGYQSAGTVEFLLDWSPASQKKTIHDFYFLEMNTRLQVEHPVTEEVFGLDLVEWQFKIAEGDALPASFKNIRPSGHSIEARIYGEDCHNQFFPAPGVVQAFQPFHAPGIRWEVGLDPVDEITAQFDPMVAKVVVKGDSRQDALNKLKLALTQTVFCGPVNNMELLQVIAGDPEFRQKAVTTHYISERLPSLLTAMAQERQKGQAQRQALLANLRQGISRHSTNPGALTIPDHTKRVFSANHTVVKNHGIMMSQDAAYQNPNLPGWYCRYGSGIATDSLVGSQVFHWVDARSAEERRLYIKAAGYSDTEVITLAERRRRKGAGFSGDQVVAPVPGKVKSILVKPGEAVRKNQTVIILESMKMDFEVQSPKEAVVGDVKVNTGIQVDADDLLLTWQDKKEG